MSCTPASGSGLILLPRNRRPDLGRVGHDFKDSTSVLGTVGYAKNRPALLPQEIPLSKREDSGYLERKPMVWENEDANKTDTKSNVTFNDK